MKKVNAFLNHNRWLVSCPIHGDGYGVTQVYPEKTIEYISPCCYPSLIAKMPSYKKGELKIINDRSAQESARQKAIENGDVYTVVFPKNMDAILEIMRGRTETANKNWTTEETIAILKEQDKQHKREAENGI